MCITLTLFYSTIVKLRANLQCCVRLHGAKSLTNLEFCATTSNNHVTSNNAGVVGQQLRPFARSFSDSYLSAQSIVLSVSKENKPKQKKLQVIYVIFQKIVQGEHELGRRINVNILKDDDKGKS